MLFLLPLFHFSISVLKSNPSQNILQFTSKSGGVHTGLVVRASDSGSGDPGSILGRVGVLFPWARDIYSPKVLVIPRNRWLRLNLTEKLLTGTLNHDKKNKNKLESQTLHKLCLMLKLTWILSMHFDSSILLYNTQ